MRRWICFLFFLAGCGGHEIPSEFRDYYASFQARYRTNPYVIPISFAQTKWGEPSYCIGGEIKVQPTTWGELSYYGKEILVYHELAHCLWNMQHINDLIIYRGKPIHGSLMYPLTPDGYPFIELREKYLEALPTGRPIDL